MEEGEGAGGRRVVVVVVVGGPPLSSRSGCNGRDWGRETGDQGGRVRGEAGLAGRRRVPSVLGVKGVD